MTTLEDRPATTPPSRPETCTDSSARVTRKPLALQGVSLRLERGEVLAVVGPSGSGKSTLLACLAGLDEPAGGSVWVDGDPDQPPERG